MLICQGCHNNNNNTTDLVPLKNRNLFSVVQYLRLEVQDQHVSSLVLQKPLSSACRCDCILAVFSCGLFSMCVFSWDLSLL